MTASPAITALIAGASEPPAPLWITVFVEAIVSVLALGAPGGFRVAPMPDKISDFDIGAYDGAILVHYKGGKYARAAGPLGVIGHQVRTVDIDIHVIARGLSGSAGAYDMLERIRTLLHGRSFAGSKPAECVDDGMVSEKDGVWDYALQIRAEAPAPVVRRDERTIINPALTAQEDA